MPSPFWMWVKSKPDQWNDLGPRLITHLTATPTAIFSLTWSHTFNMPTYKIIAMCIERASLNIFGFSYACTKEKKNCTVGREWTAWDANLRRNWCDIYHKGKVHWFIYHFHCILFIALTWRLYTHTHHTLKQLVLWSHNPCWSRETPTGTPKKWDIPCEGEWEQTWRIFPFDLWWGDCETLPHFSPWQGRVLHCQECHLQYTWGTGALLHPGEWSCGCEHASLLPTTGETSNWPITWGHRGSTWNSVSKKGGTEGDYF